MTRNRDLANFGDNIASDGQYRVERLIDKNDDTRFVAVDPYVVEGVPRFNANIDQTASGHPARKAFNLSSTTDEQVGDTSFTFTNDFKSADWSMYGSAGTQSSAIRIFCGYLEITTVSGCRVSTPDSGVSRADSDHLAVILCGEELA